MFAVRFNRRIWGCDADPSGTLAAGELGSATERRRCRQRDPTPGSCDRRVCSAPAEPAGLLLDDEPDGSCDADAEASDLAPERAPHLGVEHGPDLQRPQVVR